MIKYKYASPCVLLFITVIHNQIIDKLHRFWNNNKIFCTGVHEKNVVK